MKSNNPATRKSGNRKVLDSVYGFIVFPLEIWEFIDTPEFQRLRNIKQVGCLSWVFPGAVHSRFEHCLGTGHLAQKYIKTIIERHSDPNINPTVYKAYYEDQNEGEQKYKSTIQEAIFIVTLAGILHDIGHGPYSHLFDSKVLHQIEKGKDWEHQVASLCLIDAVYKRILATKTDDRERKWLESTQNRVKSLIIGKVSKSCYKQLPTGEYIFDCIKEVNNLSEGFIDTFKKQLKTRPWEFELISNRLTGIDVDKLDYFRRDAYYLGAKNIYIDHQLLMNETLVLENQNIQCDKSQKHRLCYPSKYSDKVYDIYYSRYKLYKTYYANLKANGVDFMIAQILKQAEPYFGFRNACKELLKGNSEKYIRLTDSILQRIEDAYDIVQQKLQKGEELKQEFEGIVRAWNLLQQLKRREIYDFIKQYHKSFSFEDIQKGLYHKLKKKIESMIQQEEKKNKDIKLHCAELGFGIKDKDPLVECKFYDKSQQVKKIEQSNESNFSMLRPEGMLQISIRLYLKNRIKNPTLEDKNYIQLLKQNTLKEVEKIGFLSGQSGTYTNRSQPLPNTSKEDLEEVKQQKKEELQFIDSLLQG